jgi:hypothetical protein
MPPHANPCPAFLWRWGYTEPRPVPNTKHTYLECWGSLRLLRWLLRRGERERRHAQQHSRSCGIHRLRRMDLLLHSVRSLHLLLHPLRKLGCMHRLHGFVCLLQCMHDLRGCLRLMALLQLVRRPQATQLRHGLLHRVHCMLRLLWNHHHAAVQNGHALVLDVLARHCGQHV